MLEALFKKKLWFEGVNGQIDTLKFRCERNFKEMPFEAGVEYKLPESWGRCLVQVIGSPDTTFSLNQI